MPIHYQILIGLGASLIISVALGWFIYVRREDPWREIEKRHRKEKFK